MAAFTLWLDDVMPELPGCSQALALYHVKRACFDLMRRGALYRKTTGAIDVAANPGDITLPTGELAADQQLLAIKKAWWQGKQLTPASLDEVEEEFGDAWQTLVGTPTYYLQQARNTVRLVPQLSTSAAASLRLSIVYGPSEAATSVADDVYDRYREPIAFGAKGRLMLMDKKPWSNAEKGAAYMGIFDAAINGIKVATTRGTAGRQFQTKPVPF